MEYKLVEGLPLTVELEVNKLMREGWSMAGNPFPRTNSQHVELVVQPMIYEQETIDLQDVMGNLVEILVRKGPNKRPQF